MAEGAESEEEALAEEPLHRGDEWVLVGVRFEFQLRKTLAERKAMADAQLLRHPSKVPVVAEEVSAGVAGRSNTFPPLRRRKLLLPRILAAGQLYYLLRQRLNLPEEQCFFLYLGGYLPRANDSLGCLYDKFKDEDGFLYAAYSPKEEMDGPKMVWVMKPKPVTPASSPKVVSPSSVESETKEAKEVPAETRRNSIGERRAPKTR